MGGQGVAGQTSVASETKPRNQSGTRARSTGGKPALSGGEPEMVQLLTPDGKRIDSARDPYGTEYTVEFTDAEYRDLYRDMVMVRRLDAEAEALQRQGELGIWASLRGQEAAQVGAGRALQPQDMAFPTYREHGVLYCRGIDPIMPLGLFRGVNQGGWDPVKFRLQMYTIVIGAQALHATGYAMGITMDGKVGGDDGEAVVAFFGDGATSQGDVNEAFVWASVYHAPIVFFCQNNQYAISEPIERQTRVPLYQRANGFGFQGIRVDGNDVLASYAVTKAALDQARRGQGPTLVEAYTYRMGAHTTSDDPTRYRLAGELEEWQAKDPITRLRTFLTEQQIAGDDFVQQVDQEAKAAAQDLRERVLALPDPQPVQIFDHVYPTGSPELDHQREQLNAYLASFEGGAH
jgi:pyruvate dehydrogenase E1 component alpha subunit